MYGFLPGGEVTMQECVNGKKNTRMKNSKLMRIKTK
jgi:hypothetical protein